MAKSWSSVGWARKSLDVPGFSPFPILWLFSLATVSLLTCTMAARSYRAHDTSPPWPLSPLVQCRVSHCFRPVNSSGQNQASSCGCQDVWITSSHRLPFSHPQSMSSHTSASLFLDMSFDPRPFILALCPSGKGLLCISTRLLPLLGSDTTYLLLP